MVTSPRSDPGQILDFVQKHPLLVIKQVPVIDRAHQLQARRDAIERWFRVD